jgi:predicted ATPase/DNA-binding SARP family transcriptional activator
VAIDLILLPRVAYRGREIKGTRLSGLFALLAGDLRTGCGVARLVAGLWPDEQPGNPAKALQILVSRARSQVGADVIVSTPAGYRLGLSEEQVDASAVLAYALLSAQRAQAGDHAGALEQAEAGLALWDGPPADEHGDPVAALRAERAQTYWGLVRTRALALSRLGRRGEAAAVLTGLFEQLPRDEEVLLELLRCEAAALGPAVALDRYDGYRRRLRDELGSDPGAALQELYQELLRGTAPVIRHGVPHEPNPLLGRADDVAAVTSLLRTSRVTSIVGPGGLGKTRLAYVVSREAEQRSVYFVALAGVAVDEDVAGEVLSAVGGGETNVLASIVSALGPGPALLVLDNCEHVVRGAAELVQALMSMSKDLRVLTTSRAPLGLSSESVYLLPELSLEMAVELFEQRAKAARPGVELAKDVVAELCGRLDGLPLAVELAAARVRVLSVAEISSRLEDRFALLRGGARDAPERHQTLHAVIDWSWNLVDPAGQAAMRALSVFPGGFTVDAAACLLDSDILPVLESLVDQSLLKLVDTPAGTRFRMLQTVREFSATPDDVVLRFLAWAREFGRAHHDSLFGAELFTANEAIKAEQDNLVLALRYALDRHDGATVAATSAVLAGLWTVESNFSRMATLVDDTSWLLAHFRPEPADIEVTRTISILSVVNTFIISGPRATKAHVTLLRLPAAPPDTVPRATDIVFRAAVDGSAEMLAACDSDHPLLAGMANGVASYFWDGQNDADSALKAAVRMLAAFDETSPWMRAAAHARIGELCLQAGQGEEARPHLLATMPVLERLRSSSRIRVQWAMMLADLQLGAVDEAERWLADATSPGGEQVAGMDLFDQGVRAEIELARGEIEAGLSSWRQISGRLRGSTECWPVEARAVTVIAHAQHDQLHRVTDIVADLPRMLACVLASASTTDFPISGALVLALANVDIQAGRTASGARLIALAEALRFVRGFQPTMSPARARETAENADRAAYMEAVSSYADLHGDGLRAAVRDQISARG